MSAIGQGVKTPWENLSLYGVGEINSGIHSSALKADIKEEAGKLIRAVQQGSIETVRFLLNKNDERKKALFDAVQGNNEEKNTILHIASLREGDEDDEDDTIEIIKILINAGAQVTAVNSIGQSPFANVIQDELTSYSDCPGQIVLYLLMNHTDEIISLIKETQQLNKCLFWVLYSEEDCKDQVKIAQKLVDKGADVNMRIDNSVPIIEYLHENGSTFQAIWLLKQESIDLSGLAESLIKGLFSHMAYYNFKGVFNFEDFKRSLQKLKESGLDLSFIQLCSQILLVNAIILDMDDLAVAILELNLVANLSEKVEDRTVLDYAIQKGNVKIFNELITRCAVFDADRAVKHMFKKISGSFECKYLDIYKELLSSAAFVEGMGNKLVSKLQQPISEFTKERMTFLQETLNPNNKSIIDVLINKQKERFEFLYCKQQMLKKQKIQKLSPHDQLLLSRLTEENQNKLLKLPINNQNILLSLPIKKRSRLLQLPIKELIDTLRSIQNQTVEKQLELLGEKFKQLVKKDKQKEKEQKLLIANLSNRC